MVIDYPIKSDINDYQTLRQFFKRYRNELVPGLYTLRVSIKPGYILKHKQDIFPSWFPPNDISKMPTDTEFENTEQWWTVDNVGEIKILTNEINYAIITHDSIQWLDNVASVHQRKELYDNLIVETAIFYMASERVSSIDELVEKRKNHKGKNTTESRKYRRKNSKIAIEQECYAWYGVNLGELIVDKLLLDRRKHPKKTPLNTLYKLCINTLYGDMVSPFFKVGNVVVGNNITARARVLAWCMEKGFNGHQTITDGCVFDLNKILYPRYDRKINGEMTVGLYADTKQYNYTYAPLSEININQLLELNTQKIEFRNVDGKPAIKIIDVSGNGTFLSPEESLKWVDKYAMKHLQNLFPNLDILHQESTDVDGNKRIGLFEFESKGFFDTATFHGSANYSLAYQGEIKIAMRSYSKKKQLKAELIDDKVVLQDDYLPAEEFLKSLYNPSSVPRSKPYIKNAILKCGDYRRNYEKWHNTNAYPGCSVEIAGLLHEFSLSQFTFKTYKQYMGWKTEHERFLRKYGQSYEMFFMNNDGTLDFENMITTIDALIRDGANNFFKFCDKRVKHIYRNYKLHSQSDCLARVKALLTARYNGFDIADNLYGDEDFTIRE